MASCRVSDMLSFYLPFHCYKEESRSNPLCCMKSFFVIIYFQQNNASTSSNTGQLLYRSVVGYLGTIEMPEDSINQSCPSNNIGGGACASNNNSAAARLAAIRFVVLINNYYVK